MLASANSCVCTEIVTFFLLSLCTDIYSLFFYVVCITYNVLAQDYIKVLSICARNYLTCLEGSYLQILRETLDAELSTGETNNLRIRCKQVFPFYLVFIRSLCIYGEYLPILHILHCKNEYSWGLFRETKQALQLVVAGVVETSQVQHTLCLLLLLSSYCHGTTREYGCRDDRRG